MRTDWKAYFRAREEKRDRHVREAEWRRGDGRRTEPADDALFIYRKGSGACVQIALFWWFEFGVQELTIAFQDEETGEIERVFRTELEPGSYGNDPHQSDERLDRLWIWSKERREAAEFELDSVHDYHGMSTSYLEIGGGFFPHECRWLRGDWAVAA